MSKDQYVQLFSDHGETVSMTKSEYLELAKQKGWNVKIPERWLTVDGNDICLYDCDVFGGDDVSFDFEVIISGTLYLRDASLILERVFAYDGIFLGDAADTCQLLSKGEVILGNHANTCDITGRNVVCGDFMMANNCDIAATDGFVFFGKDPLDYDDDVLEDRGKVSATEDIIYDEDFTTANT